MKKITGAGSGPSPASAHTGSSHLTGAQIGVLPWAQQNKLLAPLCALANAVGQVSWTSGADVYSDLVIDAPDGVVDLYVTDVHAACRLIAEARKADGSIDTSRLVIKTAPYTKVAPDAAASRLIGDQIARSLPYQLFSVAPAVDGTGLTATVAGTLGAIPVTFVQGTKPVSASGADVKWHDGSPQIPGDVLTPGGHEYCTAGIGAGPTGAFGNGQTGNYVGTVTSDYSYFDAEGLTGGNNNSDESDTSGWIPVTSYSYSYSYSYNGDYVCQDGALSFFQGAGTVCGIVSALSGTCTGISGGAYYGCSELPWVETTDIFNHLGLKLNPVT